MNNDKIKQNLVVTKRCNQTIPIIEWNCCPYFLYCSVFYGSFILFYNGNTSIM